MSGILNFFTSNFNNRSSFYMENIFKTEGPLQYYWRFANYVKLHIFSIHHNLENKK